jgi:predicted RNA binding protein YcfA (HicA-like mRNA interferase family)
MNKKVYNAVISGKSDNNIKFVDFQNLIIDLGFIFSHQTGSHKFYSHSKHPIFMNIQPDGNKAKGYQVKQLRKLIRNYKLKQKGQSDVKIFYFNSL